MRSEHCQRPKYSGTIFNKNNYRHYYHTVAVTVHLLTEDDAVERDGVDKMLFFVAIFAIVHDGF